MDLLTNLPTELLYNICTFHGNSRLVGSRLLTPRDLASLIRTHSRLYDIVLPILYRYNSDVDGSTAVLWAARNGRLETLAKALDFGLDFEVKRPLRADIRRGTGLWRTSVHHAIEHGHIDAVAWLVNHGVQVVGFKANAITGGNARGSSAFHTALELGRPEIARLLIEQGAAPSLTPASHKELLPLVAAREMSIARSAVQALGNLDPLASADIVERNCLLLIERLKADSERRSDCWKGRRGVSSKEISSQEEAMANPRKPLISIKTQGGVVMV